MLDVVDAFLVRSAVTGTVLMIASAGAWTILRKLQWMRLDQPFDAADIRTWPLAYALADVTVFAVVFSAIITTLGDGQLNVALAGGGGALVALGAVPLLIAKMKH